MLKAFGQRADGLRLERMRASPRWDGQGFRNRHPVLPGLRDPQAARPTLRDFVCGDAHRQPAGPLPSMDPREAWRRQADSGLRATWLGHSTVLLEVGGARLLTDPVWGARASPSRLAGPRRFQPVPVALRQLPPLDAVVLSHDHYDHLCLHTVRQLARMEVPFITSLGVGAHLQAFGVPAHRIVELDWWESHRLPGRDVTVHATPSQHFSGRALNDRNATLWSSLVVQSARHRVFFSGDTGLTPEFQDIGRRFGPFDLVMLEVGAFHPSWGDIHLGPRNALQALQWLGGGPLLPVHWGTFALALHAWDEPAEVLLAEGPGQGARLLMPRLGEPLEPAHDHRVKPWWRDAGVGGEAAPPVTPEPARLPPGLAWPPD